MKKLSILIAAFGIGFIVLTSTDLILAVIVILSSAVAGLGLIGFTYALYKIGVKLFSSIAKEIT